MHIEISTDISAIYEDHSRQSLDDFNFMKIEQYNVVSCFTQKRIEKDSKNTVVASKICSETTFREKLIIYLRNELCKQNSNIH